MAACVPVIPTSTLWAKWPAMRAAWSMAYGSLGWNRRRRGASWDPPRTWDYGQRDPLQASRTMGPMIFRDSKIGVGFGNSMVFAFFLLDFLGFKSKLRSFRSGTCQSWHLENLLSLVAILDGMHRCKPLTVFKALEDMQKSWMCSLGDLLLGTMVNHHQTTIWENSLGTFSRHLKQIQWICYFSLKLTVRRNTCQIKPFKNYVVVSNIFYVHPEPWGNDPIWLAHIFQMGWFNHQLEKDVDKK